MRGMHRGRDVHEVGSAAPDVRGEESGLSYPQINSTEKENQRAGCPLERLEWKS